MIVGAIAVGIEVSSVSGSHGRHLPGERIRGFSGGRRDSPKEGRPKGLNLVL